MALSAKAAERPLLITLRSQPAHLVSVQELLLELVGLVRREPGCLYYNLFQQADDPPTFWLSAAWADDEAIGAHPTPSQAHLVELIKPLLAHPMQVVPLRRVSENPS